MRTLLLIRHGETDWNRSGQIMGDEPIPLNANGRRQAADLAQWLQAHPLSGIYSSPIARAIQTAEILAASRNLPIVPESRLREIGVGDWAKRFWRDLDHEPVRLQWYTRPHEARFPNGETLAEVQQRAVAAVNEALDRSSQASLAFVSHGDVLRAIVAHFLSLPLEAMRAFRFDHASVSVLASDGLRWVAVCLNHTPLIPDR